MNEGPNVVLGVVLERVVATNQNIWAFHHGTSVGAAGPPKAWAV
jgi:hypothetical protein